MRKYRPWISLGFAFIVAFITSFLIYNYLQKRTRIVEVKLETLPVATAVADIGWGTQITQEMIKPVDFLKATVPPGCFSNGDSPVGRVAILPIKANEPILESRLAPGSIKTGGVAAIVSQKKRAVAVKVDKVIGVSGFIHHGNRVDVLVTIPTGKNSESVTKTVLENILVLTVGPELEKKGKDEKPSDVDVITLEVTPEEGEKLALAANEGKLQLALRNFSDTENVLTRGVTIPSLLASYAIGSVGGTSPKGEGERVAKKTRPLTVELIKGSKVTEIQFERSE